jgi:hypothetical protein
MPLPNFFIAGAPKAGTTSLYHYLGQHPQIYMSPLKEPCFFADEFRYENLDEETQRLRGLERDDLAAYLRGPMTGKRMTGFVTRWEDYLKLFRNARDEAAIGEASVCYLWSKTAPANIAARIPQARIVAMLRDPAERAFSAYLQVVTLDLVRMPFSEYIEAGLRRGGTRLGRFHPFLEFGLYAEQIARYLDLFPRNRMQICFYDDYQRDPLATLAGIFRFLSVDDSFVPDTSQRHLQPRAPRFPGMSRFLKERGVWRAAKDRLPPALLHALRGIAFRPRASLAPRPEDRARLVDYYRDDILKLSRLLNRDLQSWLTVPTASGTPPSGPA